MHARLVTEATEGVFPVDLEDGLADASDIALGQRHHVHRPPAAFGVSLVHPNQVAREEGRLVPSRSRSHLDDRVAVIERIPRREQFLQLPLHRVDRRLQTLHFRPGQLGQFGVALPDHFAALVELVTQPVALRRGAPDAIEPGMLTAKCLELFGISGDRGIRKPPFEVSRAGERGFEPRVQAYAPVCSAFEYRCRNRSTRPAVSINFCLPEKNGWQCEQISTCSDSDVERVSNDAPHAHSTTTCRYSG